MRVGVYLTERGLFWWQPNAGNVVSVLNPKHATQRQRQVRGGSEGDNYTMSLVTLERLDMGTHQLNPDR